VRAVSKFQLSVQQAAYMFKVFLLPKLNYLQWKLVLREEPFGARQAAAARHAHLFARQPIANSLLSSDECSSMQAVELTAASTALAHNCWTGWGSGASVHGTHSKPKSTSAWAVTIADRWLKDNFARLPIDEQLITAGVSEVGSAKFVGASIAVTSSVYPVELTLHMRRTT